MLWINFLHLYQPATTEDHFVKEATEKSYLRILRAIEENPNTKFTLNIQGCLFLLWEDLGYQYIISRIKKLINEGRIELTGTASHHALLPLVSDEEIVYQINENERILKKFIGSDFKPKGFFLPEMAYSARVAKIIKQLGYDWIIADEIAKNGKLNQVNFNKNYLDTKSGLAVIFRSRKESQSYVPNLIQEKLNNGSDFNNALITATDGELFGLRHVDQSAVFENILKNKNLHTKTISEFISVKKETEEIALIDCSWESTEEELKNGQPYILWLDKKNKIHTKLWALANLAIRTVEEYKNDANYEWARLHLARGLASCTFWWAAGRDFKLFSAISWNPDQIEKGINELIRAIRSIEDKKSRETKIEAEKMYIKLKYSIWTKHWKYYWKK